MGPVLLPTMNTARRVIPALLLHNKVVSDHAAVFASTAVPQQPTHALLPPLAAYSGLQYTDTAYVAALLFILLPISVTSLFAVFAGNAKHVRFLVTAAYAAASSYCYVLAWLCNLDTSAGIGVPIALLVLVVTGALSAFYTEVYAWPVTTLWTVLVIFTTVFQLLASLTPFKLGVLLLIPGYLTTPTPVQFVWQMCFFTLSSVIVFLLIKYLASPEPKQVSLWENGQSSCIAAYFVVGGTSYLLLLTGLTRDSCLDPVGLFATPSPLSFSNSTHMILLLLWIVLACTGWKLQTHRDSVLGQEHQQQREISSKAEISSYRASRTNSLIASRCEGLEGVESDRHFDEAQALL